jgi:hypothetical protein
LLCIMLIFVHSPSAVDRIKEVESIMWVSAGSVTSIFLIFRIVITDSIKEIVKAWRDIKKDVKADVKQAEREGKL